MITLAETASYTVGHWVINGVVGRGDGRGFGHCVLHGVSLFLSCIVWVSHWVRTMTAKKKWKLSFATLQYQPMIRTFSLFLQVLRFYSVVNWPSNWLHHIFLILFSCFFSSDNIYIFALALSSMFCPQRLPLPLPSILSWNIRAK